MFAYEKDGEPTVLLQFACFNNKCIVMGEEQLVRSEEHTSELQSLTDISYAVFCLKKKKNYK